MCQAQAVPRQHEGRRQPRFEDRDGMHAIGVSWHVVTMCGAWQIGGPKTTFDEGWPRHHISQLLPTAAVIAEAALLRNPDHPCGC
jgi:hypothetical protein